MKLLLPLVAFLAFTSFAHAADRPPNILLIMADDVGVETLGSYGGESYKTPKLDALAKSGMRFNHCYSMPVCHPTRTTLLTGQYPFRQKHPRWGSFPKSHEKKTVAQLLKGAGYATAIAGKWQLVLQKRDVNHPQKLGFDESCVFGWHEGPRYYDPLLYVNGKLREEKGKFGPDIYVDFLADFMKRNRKQPFFAYYSMALCHDVTDDLKEPVPFGPRGHYDTYAQMIAHMDKYVGKIVDTVDKLGLSENTVILFTGDNGTSKSYIHTAKEGKYIRKPVFSMQNGKRIRGGKGNLTNGGTNVPLLVRWKGVIKPGQVVDDMVDFSDWLPTLCDLGNVKVPAGFKIDGKSFANRLRGKGTAPRKYAYSERGKRGWWVRNQRYKLYNNGRLIDVKNDRLEKKPLKKDALPEVRKDLQKAMTAIRG